MHNKMKKMLKRVFNKLTAADERSLTAFWSMFYFNLLKINRFKIFEIDLNNEREISLMDKSGWDLKVIHHSELSQYRPGGERLPRDYFMHKIDAVTHCVIAVQENVVGHIAWLYRQGDPNRWFDLKEDEAQINYIFTFPAFRGRGLSAMGIREMGNWLRQRGFRRLLIEVHEGTSFMLSGIKKISEVRQVGTLTQWCIYRPKWTTGNSR